MHNITHLEVFIGEQQVGLITLLPNDKSIFSFLDRYIEASYRPILSLSYLDLNGDLITDRNSIAVKLEPFFSNLLPEGHLRSYLAEKAGVKDVREFYLMWILGRDLPGNVIIKPSNGEDWPMTEEKQLTELEIREKKEQAMRFSLAGVQLKFSALEEASGGLTIPVHGDGGSWIVKLPSLRWKGVPENEYAMMAFAKTLGMNVPDIQLIGIDTINGMPDGIGDISGNALAVKRFDRSANGDRIHIEDFAQVYDIYPDRKYKVGNYRRIADVFWSLAGEKATIEYVKRLVFNTLIGNGDMHMKNWSLIYPDGRKADIAPAYDFLSTIPYMQDKDMALNLYRGGPRNFVDLTEESFVKFAAEAKLPETMVINTVRETIEAFRDLWGEAKKTLPIEKRVSDAIETHIKAMPLTN